MLSGNYWLVVSLVLCQREVHLPGSCDQFARITEGNLIFDTWKLQNGTDSQPTWDDCQTSFIFFSKLAGLRAHFSGSRSTLYLLKRIKNHQQKLSIFSPKPIRCYLTGKLPAQVVDELGDRMTEAEACPFWRSKFLGETGETINLGPCSASLLLVANYPGKCFAATWNMSQEFCQKVCHDLCMEFSRWFSCFKLWFWIGMAGANQQPLVWKAALVRQREDRIRHIEVGNSSGVQQYPDLYIIWYQ